MVKIKVRKLERIEATCTCTPCCSSQEVFPIGL